MSEIFRYVLIFFVGAAGLASVCCVVFSLLPSKFYFLETARKGDHVKNAAAFFTLIGWGIIYYHGVYAVFWFLPENWGEPHDVLSVCLTVCLTIFTIDQLRKSSKLYKQYQIENAELERQLK